MFTLFIYIPSAITMVAISDFILSVLWGLQPYCSLLCVNFPDTLDALAGGIAFHATSSNSFGIYLCLASHPLISVFFALCRKKSPLVACKIYIFLTFAY